MTAVGADRPGIVAALTESLLAVRGNLEDARAALLRGSFAVMLVVAAPDDVGVEGVERALRPAAERLGLGLSVTDAAPAAPGPPAPRCVVSAYGADHPGIVHGVTAGIAAAGGNVVDLSARLVGDPPVYVLGVEVELPAGLDAAALADALRAVASAHRVELAVEAEDDEVM